MAKVNHNELSDIFAEETELQKALEVDENERERREFDGPPVMEDDKTDHWYGLDDVYDPWEHIDRANTAFLLDYDYESDRVI